MTPARVNTSPNELTTGQFKSVEPLARTSEEQIFVEPFSIQCDSCHASLKVAKATLIGKKLPCPKCKAFIVVPDGPVSANEPREASVRPSETAPAIAESLGGFDDVDDLLSQLPTQPAQPPAPAQSKTERAPQRLSDTEPPVPELSWDNPAATQTRRVLALAASAFGAILFLAIGCYWWLNLPRAAAPIEEAAAIEEVAQSDSTTLEPAKTGSIDSKPSPIEAQIDPQSPEPTLTSQVDEPPTKTDGKSSVSDRPLVNDKPPPIDMGETAPTEKTNDALVITSPIAKPPAAKTEPASPTRPSPTTSQPPTDGILQPVAPARSALSELSSLLEESGSSISAITDATAAVASADTIGLPKYYFQSARSAPVDIDRQLKQPCAGLLYRNVPIIDVLRDVTVISGIPITIDTAATMRLGNQKRVIPKVSVDISDTDFRDAIEQIAVLAGWTSQITETGILLTEPNARNTIEKTIDMTPIADLGDQGLDGVVDGIKIMIASDTWISETDPFSISRSGMNLTIKHVPAVVRRVERFITKISVAMQLSEAGDPGDESLERALATRLSQAQPRLSASCKLDIESRATLDHLLNRIRNKTGADVIANWETMATLGWTPLMTVPGNVSEPTLDQMLRQIERSTDSTAVVLDAHTVELTSPIDAIQRSYVEFYLITDLFKQNFTPQRILQLVQEAIESAAQPAASTMIYEPSCRCIILAAPQSTHRVVEAVLMELRQLN